MRRTLQYSTFQCYCSTSSTHQTRRVRSPVLVLEGSVLGALASGLWFWFDDARSCACAFRFSLVYVFGSVFSSASTLPAKTRAPHPLSHCLSLPVSPFLCLYLCISISISVPVHVSVSACWLYVSASISVRISVSVSFLFLPYLFTSLETPNLTPHTPARHTVKQ